MANGEICMIKKEKGFKYVIVLLCLMFILGCGNTEKNNLKSKEFVSSQENIDDLEKRNINTYQELKLIGVVDTYANADELTTLFESYDALEKMSQFNEILNKKFDFFEIYNQPLQSKFYWNIDDDFLEDYDGIPMKNQEVEIDGKKYFISSLNSIEVNFNSYNYFLDYIDEGRGFCEADFEYNEGEKVPVILGNDYKSFYSIGDVIKLNYLEKDFEYKVIGFFEKGLRVKIENSEYDMNKYLCVPFFKFNGHNIDESERIFWLRYFEEKNSGYIKVNDIKNLSKEEIIENYKTEIEKDAEQLKIKYSTLGIIYDISSEIVDDE